MAAKMTKEAARRLYVETDRNASYTGLPQATIDAHEDILDDLERRHPGIRRHAIAGAPRHFDKPLDTGTRAHQEYMRSEDGMQQADVEATQREMDGIPPKAPRPPREVAPAPGGANPRPNSRPASPARRIPSSSRRTTSSARWPLASVRAARGRAKGVAALGGSWGLYAYKVLEWGIGLSVLMLILTKSETAGKGRAPFELLFGGISTVLTGLVSTAVDPLNPHAKPVTVAAPAAVTGRARTTTPAAKAKPALTAAKTPLGAVAK